jgi:hypothetical protein
MFLKTVLSKLVSIVSAVALLFALSLLLIPLFGILFGVIIKAFQ